MAIPRNDGELVVWCRNFAAAFAPRAASLGFTQADVDALQADVDMLSYLVGDLLPAYAAALQARTVYKNLVKDGPSGLPAGSLPAAPVLPDPPAEVSAGVVPRLRQLVARIKAAPGYNVAIGMELGINEPEVGGTNVARTSSSPDVKATPLEGSRVRVNFTKAGFDGVCVESRRAGEDGWRPLGRVNYSPFLDGRPPVEPDKPEMREYRLRYLRRDEPVGDWSDIVTATTRP